MNRILPILPEDFAAQLRQDFESCHVTEPPPARRLPEMDPAERERLIAEHIAKFGVNRSIDFAADQPAIDALRAAGMVVFSSRCVDPRRPWVVNGKRYSTADLWRQANQARRTLRLPQIRRGR